MKTTSHPPCDASSPLWPSPWPQRSAARQDKTRLRRLATSQDRDREAWLLTSTAGPLAAALADAARAFVDREAWWCLGFARLEDFAREKLDRSARWVNELAALGKRMGDSPALRDAVLGTDGGTPLLLCAALKIARAADTRPIEHWIELGRRLTVRELQEALGAGDSADTPMAEPGLPDGAGSGTTQPGDPGTETGDDEGITAADAAAFEDPEELAIHGVQIRLSVPRAIRACFYETLDLHRAVSGTDATVVSFLEALTAEAAAGSHPPDLSTIKLRRGIPVDRAEHALARVNDRWRELRLGTAPFAARNHPAPSAPQSPPARPGPRDENPAQDTALIARYSAADARNMHARKPQANAVAAARAAHRLSFTMHVQDHVERELAEVLVLMSQRGDWSTLGFRSLGHYARERLGLPQRTAEGRAKVARELRRFPVVRNAYHAGALGREAARILVAVLPRDSTEERQALWVAHAQRATIKRLRDELQMLEYAAFAPGPRAADAAPGQAAAREPALREMTGNRGNAFPREPPSDREWRQSLHRAPGRTRRRLQRCMPLGDPATPTSEIDSANVFLSFRVPAELARSFPAALEAARRALSFVRPEPPPGTPDRLSHQFARAYVDRRRPVPTSIALLALLEDYALTWDDPATFPKRRWHLTYVRDGWRCMAPGCTSRRRMDCHHMDYRSRRGSNELWNLLTLCRFHHQQGEHGGYAHVGGRAPDGVLWRLGVPGLGEWYRNEMRSAA